VCHAASLGYVLILAVGLGGCQRQVGRSPSLESAVVAPRPAATNGRFKTAVIVDQIDAHYRGTNPGPIGVTTLVNADDLHKSSTFGRLFSEQMMSELSMRGYDIVELRHADALHFLSNTGELGLSRDVASVRRERTLGAIVVGTYVVSPVRVYVNARLLDPTTSVVMSAGSVDLDYTPEIARLVKGGGLAPSLERIPVRRLGFSTYPLSPFNRRIDELEADDWTAPSQAPSLQVEPKLLPPAPKAGTAKTKDVAPEKDRVEK
jgi:TolB-like protein